MSDRLSRMVSLVLATLLVAAGCAQQRLGTVDRLAVGPDAETLAAGSGQSAVAIGAAGGLQAWTEAKMLELDCVVALYQPDGSYYLTEQRYQVFPWSNAIRLSGAEPGGRYVWQLSRGAFELLEGQSRYEGLDVGVDYACIAEGILNLVTAPARLLDASVEFDRSSAPVKLEGLWYQPIRRTVKADAKDSPALRETAFYQQRSNGRVDMVLLRCAAGTVLVVRGYDYTAVRKGGVLLPSRIEVFKATPGRAARKRLIRIDLK